MTNIINLPTYEQVESVKHEMITTGGKIAATDGKTYKAVMTDNLNYASGFGKDYLKAVQDDFDARFPDIKWNFLRGTKVYLWDGIVVATNGTVVLFADMINLKVKNAVKVSHPEWTVSLLSNNGWFADNKYIYIRGHFNNSTPSFVVFDKVTFEYVTVVKFGIGGGVYFTHNIGLAGPMFTIDNKVFAAEDRSTISYFYVFNIVYDGAGKPTQILFESTGSWGSSPGTNHIIKGIWPDPDGVHIWVLFIYHSSAYGLEKQKYNKATKLFDKVASNQVAQTAPNQALMAVFTYYENGISYALLTFGSGGNGYVKVINCDTLTQSQHLFSDNGYHPTIDYETGKVFYIQRSTYASDGIYVNGQPFEPIFRYTRDSNGLWTSETYYVPMIMNIVTTAGAAVSVSRRFWLGNEAWIKNNELLLRNGRNYFSKLDTISMLDGYKEVTE